MAKDKGKSPAIATLATPLGHIIVAVGPKGVSRVSSGHVKHAKGRPDGADPREARTLAKAIKELREYFLGKRKRFTVAVDISRGTPFQRKVWRALQRIPFGKVVSYGDIARRIAMPGCARAVGQAVGANPVGIIVPCHRVIGADGKIGGWSGGGGIKGKNALLKLEGVDLLKKRKKA